MFHVKQRAEPRPQKMIATSILQPGKSQKQSQIKAILLLLRDSDVACGDYVAQPLHYCFIWCLLAALSGGGCNNFANICAGGSRMLRNDQIQYPGCASYRAFVNNYFYIDFTPGRIQPGKILKVDRLVQCYFLSFAFE